MAHVCAIKTELHYRIRWSYSGNADSFYQSVWNMLESRNIPYTFHWGKLNNLNDSRLRKMYGASRDKWINARNFLLPRESIDLFNNDMLHNFGLDEVVVNPVV